MAGEHPDTLEKVLIKADQWIYSRFDEKYTARFAAELQQEIATTLSPNLNAVHSQEIVQQYSKTSISALFENHFRLLYPSSSACIDFIEKNRNLQESLSNEDLAMMDRLAITASRMMRFIDALCTIPDLDITAVEKTLREVYHDTEEVGSTYLACLEVVHYDSTRKKASPFKPPAQTNLAMALPVAGLFDYLQLLVDETIRVQRTFIPRLFDKVLGELFSKPKK